jgi:PKD repeat protein
MASRSFVAGTWLVLFIGAAGLARADCPDPVGRWPVPVQAVTAVGTTAYLGSGSTFVVLDVSNPAAPSALGSTVVPAAIDKIAVSGSVAYVAAGAAGLRVLSVSDPAHPVEVGHADGPAFDVAVSGTYVYVASGGLTIYDVTNPASPVQVGSWGTASSAGRVVVAGEFAYVVSPGRWEWEGWAVGVSDPAHPVAGGRFALGAGGNVTPAWTDLALVGNLLFATEAGYSEVGELPSMGIFDVSNPAAPIPLGGYGTSSSPGGYAVTASGPFVLLAYSNQLGVLNIADPRSPVLTSSQPLTAGALPAAVALAGNLVLVADREGGLYLFDDSACAASGCTVAFTPVVPATGVTGAAVAFQGTYLSSGCTGTPTFDWDFGDGSPHSAEQSPSHTYAFGGTFSWSVTMSLPGKTVTTGRTITIASTLPPITSPGAYAYVVPTSAHTGGLNGTQWVTDLVLTNPGLSDAVARLYFMKASQDNTAAVAHPVVVPLRRALKLTDVVSTTFLVPSGSGAILVGSDVPLIVTSKTYNQTSTGTYGDAFAGVPLAQAFGPGQSAWLTGLSQSASDTTGFRTNIGVVNAGPHWVQVAIALYGSDGTWLGTRNMSLYAYQFQQMDRIFVGLAPNGVDGGYALVSSDTPGAVLFAYASVIDNGTGDPIGVSAAVPPTLP